MPDSYYFKLKEVDASVNTFISFSSAELAAANTTNGFSEKLSTAHSNVTAYKWTASGGASFRLPAEVDLSSANVIKFSIYSEAATNKTFQFRLNCADELKGNNTMIPYFRYTFTVDFTGWKNFEVKIDDFSGNYSPTWSRIASFNLDCSGWSLTPDSNTVLYFTDFSSVTRNYEVVAPEGVTDITLAEYYDGITAKYRELIVGNADGSTAEEYAARVRSIAAICEKYWKTNASSFKNTYVDATTRDTLFGYVIGRSSTYNTDEQKITNIYSHLLDMAEGYATKGATPEDNPYYHDAELLEDIKKGLEYAYQNYYGPTVWEDGWFGNWWHWDIGVPLNLTGILVILENELGIELCKKYLAPFDYLNPLPNMTACNKIWITRCVLLSAALQHDALRLVRSNEEVYDVFDYVTAGDGFYTDGSFIQHTNLAYTGGYGNSMLNELTNIMYFMSGSRFEWRDPEVANQYKWVFENFRPCIYDGNFMAAMRGREVYRNTSEAAAQNTTVVSMIKMQAYAPADIKPQLEALIRHYMLAAGKDYTSSVPLCLIDYCKALYANDSVTPADDYYVTRVLGNMDRVVQHGPEYGVCLSLSSTRIAKYESINRENTTGWYQGDGMIYIYTDGYDYNYSFFHYADPYLMPGTTVNSAERLANCPSPNPLNSSSFAGGVELGRYGAAGFILGYDVSKVGPSALGSNNATKGTFKNDSDASITAKKSYFIFDNEIVCLGSNISDSSGTVVKTVVENRLWESDDVFSVNGEEVSATSAETSVNASTMHFTNMGGYVFLLNDIDKNTVTYSKATNTKSFLEITLSHGRNITNGQYAYVYLPEASSEETEAYNADPDVTVIARNAQAHAVVENTLNMLGCIFYDSATVENKTGTSAVTALSSDNACAVMIQTNENGETVISVSDPSQTLSRIKLEVTLKATQVVSTGEGVTASVTNGVAAITVNCNGNVGQSYTVTLK